MVKFKKESASKERSPKALLKRVAGFVLFGLIAAVLLFEYQQNRPTSLHYLDQQGVAHSLILCVKERDRLEGLMQILFACDSFAYTALGDKPLSWQNFENPLPLSSWTRFCDSFSEYNRTMRLGWKTWEKYQHLFPSAHLWAEAPKCHPGSISILMVNERRFNDAVLKNREDFERVLGREVIDGFQLLRESKNCSLMNDVLKGHQALLGIVLGYGRGNSWKFEEGCNLRQPIGCVWEENEYFLYSETISEADIPLPYYYLSRYSCPSFSGDPNSAESLALKATYLNTKIKLIDYYKDKDFLEASLSLLAGYRPPPHSNKLQI